MSQANIVAGIDIGTSNIRTIVAEYAKNSGKPVVIGVGTSNSSGLRKGIVVDLESLINDIGSSVEQAERASGAPINRVAVSINGDHFSVQKSKSVIAVSRADSEISQEDIERSIATAQAVSLSPNKEVIHVIPVNFSVDNEENIKDPIGMHGTKLEVNTLIISGNSSFIKNLIKGVNQSGLEINNLVLSPLSAARATLTKRQKESGVVLIDIGAGTTGIAVFEEGSLLHTKIIPIGGAHVTNDIALGLRISTEAAEKIKRDLGFAFPQEISKKDRINLKDYDLGPKDVFIYRYHLAEMIEARLAEIFEYVNKELKTIDKDGMLPEGAVICGGGSKIPGTIDLAKKVLRLPAKIGVPNEMGGIVDKISDPSFATATGLIFWQIDQNEKEPASGLSGILQIIKKIKEWFKLFLP